MASLYELSAEYEQLLDLYDAAETDEERAEILDRIDAVDGDLTVKAEIYAKISRIKKAEVVAYDNEIKRLTKNKQASSNCAERMDSRICECMSRLGLTEIVTPIGKWRWRQNDWSVLVQNEDAVPQEFRKPQPDKIDKLAIKQHFKQTGEIVPGVDMQRTESAIFK